MAQMNTKIAFVVYECGVTTNIYPLSQLRRPHMTLLLEPQISDKKCSFSHCPRIPDICRYQEFWNRDFTKYYM
jgi:hypothetical protein